MRWRMSLRAADRPEGAPRLRCGELEPGDADQVHTRPYHPQTNGKAERFIQTLQNEWAYARPCRSNAERLHALPRWLYRYNARRPHGGIGGAVPASRLYIPGNYS